jgi:hypothetical protein
MLYHGIAFVLFGKLAVIGVLQEKASMSERYLSRRAICPGC